MILIFPEIKLWDKILNPWIDLQTVKAMLRKWRFHEMLCFYEPLASQNLEEKNLPTIIAAIFMSVLGVYEVRLSLDFWAETTGKETYEYTEYVFFQDYYINFGSIFVFPWMVSDRQHCQ